MFENPFVKSADDLVTTHDARRTGFLEAVLRRSREETPFLNRAKALQTLLRQKTRHYREVLQLEEIRDALLDAAGVSKKARNSLDEDDRKKLLEDFFEKVIVLAGEKYVDEIVYRYLMALGEQLGGRMRNLIGKAAQTRFSLAMLAGFGIRSMPFAIHTGDNGWKPNFVPPPDTTEEVRAIRWKSGPYERMLVYNLTVPGIGGRTKNVDIVVFNRFAEKFDGSSLKTLMSDTKTLHLMGELKGGIDPAGGDEHWKTARGALERIREAYKKAYVVYVGAAIEKAMAKEIFTQLQTGQLDYAANLTSEDQLSALCGWIIEQ